MMSRKQSEKTSTKKSNSKKSTEEKKYKVRPLWRGYVSFELISIPVLLFSAQKN